jgi:cell division protein FtsN
MPGTSTPKHPGALTAQSLIILGLAAVLALSGCSPRKPIPSGPPPAIAETPKAPAGTAPAPVQATEQKNAQAEAAPAPQPAVRPVQEKDIAEAPAKQNTTTAQPAQAALTEHNAETGPPAVSAPYKNYVQIGAFTTEANAQGALTWLKENGYTEARMVRVEQGQTVLFRVQAGPFQGLVPAHKALVKLKTVWPQAFIPVD